MLFTSSDSWNVSTAISHAMFHGSSPSGYFGRRRKIRRRDARNFSIDFPPPGCLEQLLAFGSQAGARTDILNFQASFPAALCDIVTHRCELQGERLLVMGDPGVKPALTIPPGQKSLLEWPVEKPDFAGVPMLVGVLAINYN
jgi:hypothetical protein